MRIVIQQLAEEQQLHAYRVVAESVHQVDLRTGSLGLDATVHVAWADTYREASKRATAAADAFGCRLVFAGRVDLGTRRKGARS